MNVLAHDDLGRTWLKHPALDNFYLRPQHLCHRRDPSRDNVGTLVLSRLDQRNQHQRLLRGHGIAIAAARDLRLAFDQRCLIARDATLDFGLCTFANEHHIVDTTGANHGAVQAGVQHQHGSEHERDQGHAAGGEESCQFSRPEIAKDVIEGDFHRVGRVILI